MLSLQRLFFVRERLQEISYSFQTWICIFLPHFCNNSPPASFRRHPAQWCRFIHKLFVLVILDPLLNCFAFYFGGRRNFGRTLVFIVAVYLAWFVFILYLCLIPRRYIFWKQCDLLQHDTKCEAFTEGVWFIFHFILSHWFLFLVCFHYSCAILKNAGQVPLTLPPRLPSVTICARCVRPRPMRAHHCGICGECVLRMDHHCPWIANCVGLRSHRHFYLALWFMSIGGLYMLTVGRWEFQTHVSEYEQALNASEVTKVQSPSDLATLYPWNHFGQVSYRRLHLISRCCFVFGFVAVPLVAALCVWQTYLISRGETNIEHHTNKRFSHYLQQRGLIYRNPYDFGVWWNWIRFLNLCCPNEKNCHLRKPNLCSPNFYCLFLWRIFSRVLLPFSPSTFEDGLIYDLNIPTTQSVLDSLSALDYE